MITFKKGPVQAGIGKNNVGMGVMKKMGENTTSP